MSIERVGQFIEFVVPGENGGVRTLARISCIQLVSETDCIGDEVLITAGNSRTFRVVATMNELKEVLASEANAGSGRRFPSQR